MTGISFARAATYYDATRTLPDDVRDAVADLLVAELAGQGQSLEIGVGTGRIGLPLRARGVDLVGVLRPGGALLVDFGGGTPAPWNDATKAIGQRHGVHAVRPGVSDPDVVAGYLAGRAGVRSLPVITVVETRTLAEDLHDWEHQIFSWTWPFAPEQLTATCTDVRRWAADEGWDLDGPVELQRRISWHAFEVSV